MFLVSLCRSPGLSSSFLDDGDGRRRSDVKGRALQQVALGPITDSINICVVMAALPPYTAIT